MVTSGYSVRRINRVSSEIPSSRTKTVFPFIQRYPDNAPKYVQNRSIIIDLIMFSGRIMEKWIQSVL